MATRLHKELTYDASVEEVGTMLRDPSFREQVLAALHVARGSVTVEGSQVTLEQGWASDSLPSFARKLVGNEIVMVQQEDWDAPDAARVTVKIPGKPGDMSGTSVLEPAGAGSTVHHVDMTIAVGIPLVGGKLEKLVADMLEKALEKEHATGVAWLART